MEKLSLSKVYRLIEPGPVVFLTTTNRQGKFNIMSMSYLMVVDDGETPLIAIMLGPWDYSYKAFLETRECTIAIPTVDLAQKVMEIGNCQGDKIDKFKTFNLTPLPAQKVKSPLIKECFANFECKIEDTTFADKYGMYIVKVVQAWIDNERKERRMVHHNGDGTLTVDGEILNLKDKMTRWPSYT